MRFLSLLTLFWQVFWLEAQRIFRTFCHFSSELESSTMAGGRNNLGRNHTDGGVNSGRNHGGAHGGGRGPGGLGGGRGGQHDPNVAADPNDSLVELADGSFMLCDSTRAPDGSGQAITVIARARDVLREYQGHVRLLREFNNGVIDALPPGEAGEAGLFGHFQLFHNEVGGFVARWGGAALPDYVRWDVQEFEREILGFPEGLVTRFDDSVRGGLALVFRLDDDEMGPNVLWFINLGGRNDGNGPGDAGEDGDAGFAFPVNLT